MKTRQACESKTDFLIYVVSFRPKISLRVRPHAKSDMQYLFKAS